MSESAREKQVFQSALDRPPGERTAYLDGACGGDLALRARLDALLSAHAEASAFMTKQSAAVEDATGGERSGDVIGRYKLLQAIGEGGFGSVWMAEQQQPVRRQVALKIIKRGMDTAQVIARFEAERQALALMDHPNIAKVLDGGETPRGRPFFVMELVRGVPITEFCDHHKLPARARLELFTSVCHAVQHAHHKGIIHRDLKPSNVLVTLHDGVPVPKVIDFGIAKAIHQRLTERTLFTEYRQMIGTPEYMAPEQAELSGLDIDTRADIYSLGVLLYELLTGTKPFDSQALLEKGYLEMVRVLRDEDPPRPSTRVSTLGERGTDVARRRDTAPRTLGHLLRGDLDWIVMKALEKDRARRYETASAFAEDIGRHLRDEPVHASPPSGAYRLRKYVRRHRVGVAAGAAVAVALLVGLGTAVWGLLEARDQAERATNAEVAAREAAADASAAQRLAETRQQVADQERARALERLDEQYVSFSRAAAVFSSIGQVVPETPKFNRLRMDIIERVAPGFGERVDGFRRRELMSPAGRVTGAIRTGDALIELGKPAERAVRFAVADMLTGNGFGLMFHRGRPADGARFVEHAYRLLADDLTATDPRSVRARVASLDALQITGRNTELNERADEFIEMLRALYVGDDDPQMALYQSRRAVALVGRGDHAAAEQLFARTIPILERTFPHSFYLGRAQVGQVELYEAWGRPERAEECRQALIETIRLSSDYYALDGLFSGPRRSLADAVASLYRALDREPESDVETFRSAYREVIRLRQEYRIDDLDPLGWILGYYLTTAAMYFSNQHGGYAHELTVEILADLQRIHRAGGARAAFVLQDTVYHWILSLRARGDLASLDRYVREAVASFPAPAAGDTIAIWFYRLHLGDALRRQGELEEAEHMLRQTHDAIVGYTTPSYGDAITALRYLVQVYDDMGRDDDAIRCMREVAEALPSWGNVYRLANTMRHHGRDRDAEDAHRRAAALNPESWGVAAELARLAAFRYDGESARTHAAEALRLAGRPDVPASSQAVIHAIAASVHSRLGDLAEVRRLMQRAIELEPDSPARPLSLGAYLSRRELRAEAARCYQRALELDPDYALAVSNLAGVRLRDGAIDEALDHASRAYSLDPEVGASAMAEVLAAQGDHAAALPYFEEFAAQRDRPYGADIWNAYGRTLIRLGRVERAREVLASLTELWPDDPMSYQARAWFLSTADGLTDADRRDGLECAQTAVELSGRRSPLMLATLAEARYRTGDAEAAVRTADDALRLLATGSHEYIDAAEVRQRRERYRAGG